MVALQNDRLRSMPASFLPPSPVHKPGTENSLQEPGAELTCQSLPFNLSLSDYKEVVFAGIYLLVSRITDRF